ncbi:MAG: bifunctional adenosylcobinamide kinase/adenosylcobinamide-phosphate guanylyltransferase [Lachnospiraceae bacterium]|nr:bifunctional adenosylcobinamide kinase/adenosylcobinamide-phosphate guanylyltransferase [Lachnospiraceae bacterium]
MITIIIGGSGSGKSEYAENYIMSVSEGKQKYYLATMQVYDEEGQKKINRHRNLRQGKGFLTIEQPVDIDMAVRKMEYGEKVVLLECMSNLVANEMFGGEASKKKNEVVEKIIREIHTLQENVTELVIVTNNVFEDGISYDDTTMEYLAAMGRINELLAKRADKVIEVVVGIPLIMKG